MVAKNSNGWEVQIFSGSTGWVNFFKYPFTNKRTAENAMAELIMTGEKLDLRIYESLK